MRVLVFNWKDLSHPAAGGAEIYTEEILRRWAAAGDEVTLFSSAVPGMPAHEERHGVRIVRGGSRYGVYREARRFYDRHGRGRVDVVIDEVNTRPFGCARWVCDAPVVALIHQVAREIWFQEFPLPIAVLGRHVLEPYWLKAYAEIPTLTVSESSKQSLHDYGLRNVHVVPVGLTLPSSLPSVDKNPHPTIVFVGRLAGNKQPHHALEAFDLLHADRPSARLWIVGSGPLEQGLKRKAGEGVTFFGRVDERTKLELMARAHALVVPSLREGWGLVVDEAAAVGTPTFGYDVAGLRDSVAAASGVLVQPDPKALARALTLHLAAGPLQGRVSGWSGGARSWDDVARDVRSAVVRAVVTPGTPALPGAASR